MNRYKKYKSLYKKLLGGIHADQDDAYLETMTMFNFDDPNLNYKGIPNWDHKLHAILDTLYDCEQDTDTEIRAIYFMRNFSYYLSQEHWPRLVRALEKEPNIINFNPKNIHRFGDRSVSLLDRATVELINSSLCDVVRGSVLTAYLGDYINQEITRRKLEHLSSNGVPIDISLVDIIDISRSALLQVSIQVLCLNMNNLWIAIMIHGIDNVVHYLEVSNSHSKLVLDLSTLASITLDNFSRISPFIDILTSLSEYPNGLSTYVKLETDRDKLTATLHSIVARGRSKPELIRTIDLNLFPLDVLLHFYRSDQESFIYVIKTIGNCRILYTINSQLTGRELVDLVRNLVVHVPIDLTIINLPITENAYYQGVTESKSDYDHRIREVQKAIISIIERSLDHCPKNIVVLFDPLYRIDDDIILEQIAYYRNMSTQFDLSGYLSYPDGDLKSEIEEKIKSLFRFDGFYEDDDTVISDLGECCNLHLGNLIIISIHYNSLRSASGSMEEAEYNHKFSKIANFIAELFYNDDNIHKLSEISYELLMHGDYIITNILLWNRMVSIKYFSEDTKKKIKENRDLAKRFDIDIFTAEHYTDVADLPEELKAVGLETPIEFEYGHEQRTGQCLGDTITTIVLHLHKSIQHRLLSLPNYLGLDNRLKYNTALKMLLLIRERFIRNFLNNRNPLIHGPAPRFEEASNYIRPLSPHNGGSIYSFALGQQMQSILGSSDMLIYVIPFYQFAINHFGLQNYLVSNIEHGESFYKANYSIVAVHIYVWNSANIDDGHSVGIIRKYDNQLYLYDNNKCSYEILTIADENNEDMINATIRKVITELYTFLEWAPVGDTDSKRAIVIYQQQTLPPRESSTPCCTISGGNH